MNVEWSEPNDPTTFTPGAKFVCRGCCAYGTLHGVLDGIAFVCPIHNVSLFIKDGEVVNMGTHGVAQ